MASFNKSENIGGGAAMVEEPQKESAWHYQLLLRLCYFVFGGEQNYEINFLRVLAVQLLDFSGFVCRLY